MTEIQWIWVVAPNAISEALGVPLLTITDTLHYHYSGPSYAVRGVGTDRPVMYSVAAIEDWVSEFFPTQVNELAMTQLSNKSISIARKIDK